MTLCHSQRNPIILKTSVTSVNNGEITKKANIFFDEGSSLSYITTQLAKEHFTGTELQIPQVETLRRSKRIASRPRPQYVESVNYQSRLTAILLTCGVSSAHAQRQKKRAQLHETPPCWNLYSLFTRCVSLSVVTEFYSFRRF